MTSAPAARHESILKIASGGTAAVWVGIPAGPGDARDAPLVAIKRPHAHLADDPSFRRALVSEATIASSLRHPNVVEVRDIEEDEAGVHLVMRYVEGASLSELIRSWSREPPPSAASCALRVALDTCAGLGALHDLADPTGAPLGLVHRDVSPANVLVGVDGAACITDFGLAKSLYAVERTTSEGALRGKLGYMAPEYVRGKPIDRRIDVFAMGVVVWEALAQKRLFRGENDGDTLERVLTLTPPTLADLAPELGAAAAALDAALARALAKDPAARTGSVAELARDLEAVARAHGLLATHAEVAASFGPTLAAELAARRAQIAAALAARSEAGARNRPGDATPLPAAASAAAPTRAGATPDGGTRAHATPDRASSAGGGIGARRRRALGAGGLAVALVAIAAIAAGVLRARASAEIGGEPVAPGANLTAEPAAANASPESASGAAANAPPAPSAVTSLPDPGENASPEPAAANASPEPRAENASPEPGAATSASGAAAPQVAAPPPLRRAPRGSTPAAAPPGRKKPRPNPYGSAR